MTDDGDHDAAPASALTGPHTPSEAVDTLTGPAAFRARGCRSRDRTGRPPTPACRFRMSVDDSDTPYDVVDAACC